MLILYMGLMDKLINYKGMSKLMTNLDKKNKIEYLGFVRLLSDYASNRTNELQINNKPMLQKDIVEFVWIF